MPPPTPRTAISQHGPLIWHTGGDVAMPGPHSGVGSPHKRQLELAFQGVPSVSLT